MLKQKLQSIKQDDSNLYSHLTSVLRQLILTNDRDSYQLFEHYSQRVKQGDSSVSNQYRTQELSALTDYVSNTKKLLAKPNTGTQQEPAQPGPTGYVPNLMQEAKWFEKAGVGFGEQCTYLIFKSLERFSILKQIKELKFWGKIIGSGKDYYIAQGQLEGGQQGQLPPDVQPKGTGVNKMTYWVCSQLNGDWKELPIVTPEQIIISRKIRYQFTGDLDRQIYSNPHFKGKEAHLLKCQIVRINFSCAIVPRTMYKVNQQDKKQIEPTQQWKIPNFESLSSLTNWVHHPQNILKNGRLTLLKPSIPEGEEVDQQKLMKELEQKDPLQQRLKPLSKDLKDSKSLWAIRCHGDTSEYRAMTKAKQQINYGFVSIRSLVWKGWTLIYHNKQWTSIYVGNGFKYTDGWYYPQWPEFVLQEKGDSEEVPQPNFPPQQIKKQSQQQVPAQQ